jgi:hypothetical protein
MKMKDAIKFGFGAAFGVCLFQMCKALVDKVTEKRFKDKFDTDPEFRLKVKEISPETYVKYRKENKMTEEAVAE